MTPKKHIIIIGVLCVIALGLGYWVGLPKEGSGEGSKEPEFLKQGLVAYYPFNGNAKDESGNGNDGEVKGATLSEDRKGQAASAYSFDGEDDIITIPSIQTLDVAGLTLSAWINPGSLNTDDFPRIIDSGNMHLVGSGSGHIYAHLRGRVHFTLNNGDLLASTRIIPLKEWSHVVAISTGEKISIYWNGQQEDEKDENSRFVLSGIKIGAKNIPDGNREWLGQIDDIRIYNRALTKDQVKALYEFEKPKTQQASTATPIKVVPNSPAATAAIEAAIRMAASKPTGELTKADFDKVKALGIAAKKLTDISVLAKMEWMTSVDLGGNLLTDGQLKHFVGLKKLKHLRLNENRLKDISALAGLTQLELLHLNGNLISDVSALKELKQLQTLTLTNNPDLTKAQIDELKKALPKCEITSNATK